jgi:signal transduction histidine kinase/CheY-like chemotaxis protein
MSIPLRVLLVEDSEHDAELLVRELQRGGFDVSYECVETAETMREALIREDGRAWDIILCDYSMPKFDALSAIKLIRELDLHIPCIVVSGHMGEEHAVETMRAGAHDYIMKDSLERLCVAVQRELEEAKGYVARKQAEAGLQRSMRALHALSACNEALIHASEEQGLLDEICRIIVEIADYKMAWVGYAMHDDEKSVKPIAHWGYEDRYVDNLGITWDNSGRGKGPTGTAIRSGKAVVCQDILHDSRCAPWRESAQKHGYASSAAFPLVYGDTILGALNIYSRAVDGFHGEELDLLQRMANNIAYGINVLRVEETKQLLQKELLQAQKMEAIGQLTGGIAHDFNNILVAILGYTDLALLQCNQQGMDELGELLRPVKEAGERARDLIAQMMVFSRSDKRESRRISVQAVVEEAIKMLRASLPSSMEIVSHFPQRELFIYEDPVRLHQMVMNLCINARDAMDAVGRVVITLRRSQGVKAKCASCQAVIPNQAFVELSVSDAGTGMDSLLLSRVFEPFFTTKEVGKGTGMGLSVVHAIVHEMGGHILVNTESGKGTEIQLLLPEMATPEAESIATGQENTQRLFAEKGSRILVVDDEKPVASLLKDLLEAYGYVVDMTTNSQAAYVKFEHNPEGYDLVITDQTMPYMMGYELAQKMLALKPDLPVILCTGYSEEVHETRAKDGGIKSYIQKPWDNKYLLKVVKELLAESALVAKPQR